MRRVLLLFFMNGLLSEAQWVDSKDRYGTLSVERGPLANPIALHRADSVLDVPIRITPFYKEEPISEILGPCDLPPNQGCHFTQQFSEDLAAAIIHIPDIQMSSFEKIGLPHDFDKMIIGFSTEPPYHWHHVTNHRLETPIPDLFGNRTVPFDAMATHHLDSEVPVLYSYYTIYNKYIKLKWDDYQTPPPPDQKDAATLVVQYCKSHSQRCAYVRELSKYVKVVTPSRAILKGWNATPGTPGIQWERDLPDGVSTKPLASRLDIKKQYIRQYKVHLAFENSRFKDYVSEKLHHALHSGVLPVYRGSADVNKFFPPNSMINANDMTPRDLGLHLQEVFRNKTLFDSYHAWRYEPFPREIQNRLGPFVDEHWSCRICKFVLAKVTGRGWDQPTQRIVDAAETVPVPSTPSTYLALRRQQVPSS